MPRTHHVLPALLIMLTAACGAEDTGATPGDPPSATRNAPSSTAEAGSDHNGSDVEFVGGMIPHHEQAAVVAGLASERASSPEVKDLAERIASANEAELDQLLALPKLWGVEVTPGTANDDHDHSHLMSEETFQRLEQSTGPDFDTLWLENMIEHHEGAVEMAEAQLRDGKDPLASMYAQDIVDRQSKEIDEMKALLGG
ncbi:DUF305 domain-containing protein [Saccharomonospora xinjiangensis]|uniref:DUF305 domain-containing protein n=1 Tax=Saccharomonospora xinjiangensis TaxID=75294 RepID=UPI00106F23D1|nr:DUF305 domain-containing protein [Saccharomonospora xinjiangensis]QBQ60303.1 hypothetical protein EYD13_09735 [Saccharomonospora xinjiangensis]